MKVLKLLALTLSCLTLFAGSIQAAPLNLTLVRTTVLYNEDPPGAPLPLGRTQYDAGDIMLNNQKIGEYLLLKDVHAAGMNVAGITMSLFFPSGTDVPFVLTLQGVHSFVSGDERGSISASDISGVVGVRFLFDGSTDILTLLFP